MKRNLGRVLLFLVIFMVVVLALIQLIPYGHNHTNPPIVQNILWDTPETKALAVRACFDCHSNETVWPWYSNIAPISWLTVHDVEEGRSRLNFSDIGSYRERDERIGDIVLEGEMPPLQYYPTHPEARLTAAERQALAQGLDNSLAATLGK